ncbi:hypothetical protein ACFPJ1_23415 [Kribbella qitaiheensis]|uniref:hypothetical protein n=1 Tax=Kribbella qitaiheensis TaxID=1544730 RepID=UPI00361BC303
MQASRGAWQRLVRIDVWTDNVGLHRYYEQRGFRHVQTLDLGDYPSGALFQRAATGRHQTQQEAVITELTHDLPTSSQPETSARRARITLVPSIAWPTPADPVIRQ